MGDERGDLPSGKGTSQGPGEQRPDHALRLSTQDIQRVGSGQGGIRGAFDGQQADLGAVAVRDDEFVVTGECGEGGDGPVDVGLLHRGVGAFAPVQQGVAAEGDDDAHGSVLQGGDEYGLDGVQPVLGLVEDEGGG